MREEHTMLFSSLGWSAIARHGDFSRLPRFLYALPFRATRGPPFSMICPERMLSASFKAFAYMDCRLEIMITDMARVLRSISLFSDVSIQPRLAFFRLRTYLHIRDEFSRYFSLFTFSVFPFWRILRACPSITVMIIWYFTPASRSQPQYGNTSLPGLLPYADVLLHEKCARLGVTAHIFSETRFWAR